MAMPSASSSAVWKELARRVAMSGRTTMRSTTTSMSCLSFLSSAGRLGDLVERAVDLDPLEALLLELRQLLAVLALAAADDRREQVEARAFRQRHDAVDHLRDGLALDRQAGRRRVGHADARVEQPHVVVDLGDGADGRARVPRGRLLLDGDGRRQAVDLVDVRLLHHLQELAGIGRQRFDVAALALGVDRVEGERRFAGAGQAGEHDQVVARQVEVDVLEVVLARPADRDHAGVGPSRRVGNSFMRARGLVGGECTQRNQAGPVSPPLTASSPAQQRFWFFLPCVAGSGTVRRTVEGEVGLRLLQRPLHHAAHGPPPRSLRSRGRMCARLIKNPGPKPGV